MAQDKLAQQLKQLESENMALKADLGFFERLLPAGAAEALTVRALQAEAKAPGQLRYQLLVMQMGKSAPEFTGRYDIVLTGLLDGKPWSLSMPNGGLPLAVKQYLRLEGMIDHPLQAVVKTVQVKVIDSRGTVRATQMLKL